MPRLSMSRLIIVMLFAAGLLIGCGKNGADNPTATKSDNLLVKGSHAADEKLAVSQLRAVQRAEQVFRGTAGRYGTMAELVDKGMLTHDPSGQRTYKFVLAASQDRFQCVAVPQVYGTSGRYSFYIDENGDVHGGDHKGAPATPDDERLDL